MNGQAFLGCKINLISRAGIRYEGILYMIDTNNSTVALSKVKSFGTEDRYAETAVPPREEIYEYIIFRGSDIQDLHVCETPKKQPQIMSQDPAILEITGKPPISASYSKRRVQFTSRSYQRDDREIPYIDDMCSGSYYQGYNDEELQDMWPERVPSRSYYSRSRTYYPYKYEKEYDFESANAEIAKELERLTLEKKLVSTTTFFESQKNNRESKDKGPTGDSEQLEINVINCDLQMNGTRAPSEPDPILTETNTSSIYNEVLINGFLDSKDNGYNVINYDRAKSFYDNISSEATDRARGKMIRAINWRDERKLNVETFGFNISSFDSNRSNLRRNMIDVPNTLNTSNSSSNRIAMQTSSSFYKQDMVRYHPPPGSYYTPYYSQSYYQPRWFSRRPEYHRVPTYVQA